MSDLFRDIDTQTLMSIADDLKRQAGLTARYAASGVAGLGAAFANPLAYTANQALDALGSDYRFPDQYDALQQAMTDIGLPEPETGLEKGVGFAAELGVPDPTDSARVVAQISHMIDPNAMSDLIQAMTVFHGTPHKWADDRPDMSKIGTGEGAQAYGHGLYFAETPDVASSYRFIGNDGHDVAGELFGWDISGLNKPEQWLLSAEGGDINAAIRKAQNSPSRGGKPAYDIDALESVKAKGRAADYTTPGHLYELDLPDSTIDKMLDWDKPLSEQPESVQRAVRLIVEDAGGDYEKVKRAGWTGGDFHDKWLGGDGISQADVHGPEMSNKLKAAGIPGIKYLDGTSRSAGEGTRNFVIFDDSLVTPLKRNNEPIGK